jgi:predicted O-methyltransferase YrrM
LLQTLVAAIPSGTFAEFGTGAGYSTAWILAGLQPAARFVTVETDGRLAESARASFSGDPRVEVIQGDWRELLERAPFAFAFVDVRPAKLEQADLVIEALAPGGVALIDDLTPFELWPDEWRGKPDELRERWLLDERLHAVEVRVAADHAAIIATRKAL